MGVGGGVVLLFGCLDSGISFPPPRKARITKKKQTVETTRKNQIIQKLQNIEFTKKKIQKQTKG